MLDSLNSIEEYNTEIALCQVLFDETHTNLSMHMHQKDKMIEKLISASELIDRPPSFIQNLKDCGTLLKVDKEAHILQGNFCKARLCPVCAWKRSLRLFHEVRDIVSHIKDTDKARYIFVTLTQPNVTADNLSDELSRLMYSFKRFRQFARIKKSAIGMIKGLEVTHNPTSNTYHPHMHVLIAVHPSYFKRGSPLYISQEEFMNLWKKATDSTLDRLNVDIRAVKKGEEEKAIAEISKYTVKLSSVCESENIEALATVMRSIHGRRMFTYSGIFRDTAKLLKIDLQASAEDETPDTITADESGSIGYISWSKQGYKFVN